MASLTIVYPIVYSLSSNTIKISNSGRIVTLNITAQSGSADDIQAAIDLIEQYGGVGNVSIPSGTFNFVEPGEPWKTVVVPCGINIFGAETVKDSDGQVVEWKTILKMTYEAPDGSVWFRYQVDDANDRTFRFSDIQLVGWRYNDISSTTMYTGVSVVATYGEYPTAGVKDFRIDHCNFQDMAGSGVYIAYEGEHNRRIMSGVIDHNRFVNSYGDIGFMHYEDRSLGYGIGMRRWASDVWEEDVSEIWGHYTNYTVVIEDNYFSRWRHATCSNDGIHQIVRYNIVNGSYGHGTFDGHGSYRDTAQDALRWYAVGTRCMEVYNNVFMNYDDTWGTSWVVNIRGGSALVYNNELDGSFDGLLDLNNDWGNYDELEYCAISDTYIWNNQLNGGSTIHYNADSTQNEDYFFNEPTNYTPYQYPHPLTLE